MKIFISNILYTHKSTSHTGISCIHLMKIVYIYILLHTYIHIQGYKGACIHTYIYTYTYIFIHIYIFIYICTYVCTYIYICTYVYLIFYKYTSLCKYTYTHFDIYIYIVGTYIYIYIV